MKSFAECRTWGKFIRIRSRIQVKNGKEQTDVCVCKYHQHCLLTVILAKGQETNIYAVTDHVRHWAKQFLFFSSFNPQGNIEKWVLFLHFTDEEIDAERS